jgi:hypothetical protein
MHHDRDDHERQHRHHCELPAIQRAVDEMSGREEAHQQRIAARPATLNFTPAGLDAAALIRHGRHKNAAPAPSRRPLERASVDRYMKLVRSDVSAVGDARKK